MTDVADLAPAPASDLLAPMRGRGVTAVLGPTNTGKTHLAIERMASHGSGLIGLPLRLLAREVYQRLVERVGAAKVALVTGEEKIKPHGARYWVCTVEAMPRDLDVDFVAIDEIQLCADLDRGHVFTDRLLNLRGRYETLALGAATMRPLVEKLLPGAHVITRPRLSQLLFAGERKITRLPPRSAIVAFSADEVYAIAELVRRQRGGAAVVLGALSPRTRNAQVAMYQAGDVDYLIATDAVGMGLNLDVDHVAFAGDRKFDGHQFRRLNPSEIGQVAGRAGRHLRDGTFGTTGRCPPFEPELVERLEGHSFDPVRVLQWRNGRLDFASVGALVDSLSRPPAEAGLTRAPDADDLRALIHLNRDPEVRAAARGPKMTRLLWEVCQVPDYRKIAPAQHTELLAELYGFLSRPGMVPTDWFARHVALTDRADGDIDTLSARIAHIRTWTFVANRSDWLDDPEHWQGVTRSVEDRLSDALHERLAQRFVDRRTSVLMRRLREKDMLEAEINKDGDVVVEGHHVGRLAGFQFAPDSSADTVEGKALRAAAAKALAGEIEARANRFANVGDGDIVLASDGAVRWQGELVGRLVKGDKTLAPRVRVLADDQLTGAAREQVDKRLDLWIRSHVQRLLGPLAALESAEDVTGVARGVAYQLVEDLGVLDRARVADEVKGLEQDARASLRKHGVRFGAHHIYLPTLMKPAPRALAAQLWALAHGHDTDSKVDDIAHLAASGRTSIPADKEVDKGLYRALGYRVCGERAIRVDILERLADLIRPAIAWKPGQSGVAPAGAADGNGFTVTVAMTSLAGCSGEDFAAILRALGYRMERKPKPAEAPASAAASTAPSEETAVDAAADIADEAGETQPTDAVETMEPASAEAGDVPVFDAASEAPALVDPVADEPEPETVDAVEAEDSVETATEEAAAVDAPEAVEADAGLAAVAAESAPTEAAEPEFIEVWRPGGFGRRERPERGGRDRRPAGGDRGPRGEGRGRGPRPQGDRPQGDRPQGERAASAERPQGEGARAEGGRPERSGGGRPHRGDRPERRGEGGRPGGDRPHQGRRDGGRSDRPRDDRRDRGGSTAPFASSGPKRSERGPDPDSPFAKLLALKAQLETGGRPKGTDGGDA
ncbi:helicase [Methylopila jiangsuensis]|uniref:Helicase n=1 Tax=Methylopila jiangsuensis TaxID=586230 RepID=A0A9W6JJM0_9HYPH|nr:helicase-related protein [Methylopila jiangsuensis]MDR6284383.1 ATP-dependent RNA helicase SUPV3L1/SUV3 [Methylopila jiangsuensis]GLK78232.1 helicase [Methylopila jiangsuensis]